MCSDWDVPPPLPRLMFERCKGGRLGALLSEWGKASAHQGWLIKYTL